MQKKLEQIKSQRQKDAKELVAMKHVKDKAVSEMTELRKQNQEMKETVAGLEEEMGRIRESMSHVSMKLGLSLRGRGQSSGGKTPALSQVSANMLCNYCFLGGDVLL